jgi:hypothetical protein
MRARDVSTLDEMYARTRSAGFGAEVKRRIMLGTYALSAGYYEAFYVKAQQVRALIRRDFDVALEGRQAIAVPTSPTTAFRLGERTGNPLQMYLSDIFTVAPRWLDCRPSTCRLASRSPTHLKKWAQASCPSACSSRGALGTMRWCIGLRLRSSVATSDDWYDR